MKRYSWAATIAVSLLVGASCKKENTDPLQPENAGQALSKIIRIIPLGNEHSYNEEISYTFNVTGKMIGEGDKTYTRDEQQRITEIWDKSKQTNRNHTFVYYSEIHPQQVLYTLSNWSGQAAGYDSVAYIHNETGDLLKTMTYVHQYAGSYLDTINYYPYTLPDITYLSNYTDFRYDKNGNIIRLNFYSVSITGEVVLCGSYTFSGYTVTKNPQYSGDEVRMADYPFYGTTNNSKNNFSSIGNYYKDYEYRSDGRPRTCIVREGGEIEFTLKFEYQ